MARGGVLAVMAAVRGHDQRSWPTGPRLSRLLSRT